ncbi:molybdopterin-dependent oxidoreductase [Pseudonocardia sp. GCM10023141]|uniref:molybdopterin-dependent oxidoreductase n=1 Tax=Pseudonocardia sp. GCM10023141 TaxID=3252653 RepID=UPI003607A4B3
MSGLPALRRAGRRTNLALLLLLMGAFGTGWLAFAAAAPVPAELVTTAHGLLGLGIIALAPWKATIVRRARTWRPMSLLLAVAIIACLAGGFALVFVGPAGVAGLTAVQLHVGGALIALPLLVVHLVRHRRRQGFRRRDISRRALLRTGAFAAATGTGYLLLEGVGRWTGSAAAGRAPTGSHQIAPSEVPATIWLLDRVPLLDPTTHHVDVAGRPFAIIDLAALAEPVDVRLDCTSGWYAEETWTATRLDRLLPATELRAAASIEVVSATGYTRLFAPSDAGILWLATATGGQPLRPGRGAPVRLVAPGRRGFWWVKWVSAVHLSGTPYWAQSPFPLQ